MSAEENKAIVSQFYEAWNQGNLDEVYKLIAPTYINHRSNPIIGREGFKQLVTMYRTAFDDQQHVVEEVFAAEGDRVVSRATIYVTHKGEFMGVPASGKRVKTTAMNIMYIADNMIAEQWEESDIFGFLQQIGAVPGPGQSHT